MENGTFEVFGTLQISNWIRNIDKWIIPRSASAPSALGSTFKNCSGSSSTSEPSS